MGSRSRLSDAEIEMHILNGNDIEIDIHPSKSNKRKAQRQEKKCETKTRNAQGVIAKNSMTLEHIEPLTDNQGVIFSDYNNGKHKMLLGYPGTGKTMMAVYLALKEMIDTGNYHRIVIVRSAVATRDIGFLPGTEAEKSEVYELPYRKILSDILGRDDAYTTLKKENVIRFMLTSYVRGLTMDNSIVIVDECQNLSGHELSSIITRTGHNTKIIFAGDILQSDFTKTSEKSGISKFVSVIEDMNDDFDVYYLGIDDIVRSGLVKNYITTLYNKYPDGI